MVSLERVMPGASVSIVVPVLSDAEALSRLVSRIRGWRRGPAEIIAVSAGPDERLRRLCASIGCRYIEATRCRGEQLDAGARAASGEILWFLHADAAPHPGSVAAIERAVEDGAIGGFFRFHLGGEPAAWKKLVGKLTNLRVRLGGIPYGDQALFVTRGAYVAAGGYEHQPLFEEVRLVRALRRIGHFRGLELSVDVAARRWERDGWIYRSLSNRVLALRYSMGAPVERLAARYEETTVPSRNVLP